MSDVLYFRRPRNYGPSKALPNDKSDHEASDTSLDNVSRIFGMSKNDFLAFFIGSFYSNKISLDYDCPQFLDRIVIFPEFF